MSKIIFFNHFHNGDLHISREFIRKIMFKVNQIDSKITFTYAHANDPCLLSDIPNLGYERLDSLKLNQFENLTSRGSTTFINTWYAQQHHKYMNVHGMTLDCLYAAFSDSCKSLWQFNLEDIFPDASSFIPTIDYSKFEISLAEQWLSTHPQKKIFVSNGLAMSGQATNFPMTPIIAEIAKVHSDKLFILSNFENHQSLPTNVVYSKDIIRKSSGSDLNENSFLTTHCDLIIGRASGVFSYAWTQENLLERNCKFLAFCLPGVITRPPHQFWTSSLLHDKIKYSAQIFESAETEPKKVRGVIESHL